MRGKSPSVGGAEQGITFRGEARDDNEMLERLSVTEMTTNARICEIMTATRFNMNLGYEIKVISRIGTPSTYGDEVSGGVFIQLMTRLATVSKNITVDTASSAYIIDRIPNVVISSIPQNLPYNILKKINGFTRIDIGGIPLAKITKHNTIAIKGEVVMGEKRKVFPLHTLRSRATPHMRTRYSVKHVMNKTALARMKREAHERRAAQIHLQRMRKSA